jgi:large subunit ribosomal protein L15
MSLDKLKPAKGSTFSRKRVGRGTGSGLGKTSGRGEKGQKSRSGFSRMRGFEGGQMPLHRRLPKRGFTNIFRKDWAEINLRQLERIFAAGTSVDLATLREARLIRGRVDGVRILATGTITKPLVVSADHFSATARKKIEAAGGRCILPAGEKA